MRKKDYYENYWEHDIKGGAFGAPPQWSEENLLWHLNFFKGYIGKKVLDVGAGDGTFLNFLISNVHQIIKATALELSSEAIKKGRRLYKRLEFKQGEIEKMKFPNGTFDTVLAIEVVEHLLDVDRCLSEINRVLKRGGYLCVTTTDFNLPKKVVIALFFWEKFFYPNTPHIRFFTRSTLTDICRKHGLELVESKWNRSYFGLMPKGQMTVFRKT